MHALFHIRTVIIPRPISTLWLKPSGRYRSLGMITARVSISVEGWWQSWYGKGHALIYLSHISTLNWKEQN